MTRTNLKEFATFFAIQFLAYGLVCWNFRMIAQAKYGGIFASDLGCAFIGFTLVKRIAAAESKWAKAGYVLGGAVGSVVSVWMTKRIYGQ